MGQAIIKWSVKKITAIELMAQNPDINDTMLCESIGINIKTLYEWKKNPEFIERLYDRYMECAGIELPLVIQSLLREAKLGNVRAIELCLKHFGKLKDVLHIKIESPFKQFLHSSDADAVEIEPDQKQELIESINIPDVPIPKRDDLNDSPIKRMKFERDRVVEAKKKVKDDNSSKIRA